MDKTNIDPEKITRPFQLLAAWLVGLVALDGAFLAAAAKISIPDWAPGALVAGAIINVPLFLASIFLLQTRFRPEMQEDSYYSKYLERKYSLSPPQPPSIDAEGLSRDLTEKILAQLGPTASPRKEPIRKILLDSQLEQTAIRFGRTRTLSELFLAPRTWFRVVEKWGKSDELRDEVERLAREGLVDVPGIDFKSARLTDLGQKIAETCRAKGILFAQERKEFWEKEHRTS